MSDLAKMADLAEYRQVYAQTEGIHRCEVTYLDGSRCGLSQEEHHRLAMGMLTELADLRRKVAALEGSS